MLQLVFFICLGLSAIALLIFDPVWGFYDSFMALLSSGSLNNVFLMESYHLGLRGIIPLLSFLHHKLPLLPWMGIIMLLSWVFVQTVLVFICAGCFPNQKQWLVVAGLWCGLQLFVFGVSFIEFSITGMGMLLTFTAVIALYFTKSYSGLLKWGLWFISAIAIFIGYGMRIESGVGGTLLAFVFIVCTEQKLVEWLKTLWLPAAISIYSITGYQLAVKQNGFFDKVEPLVFYVTDSKNKPDFAAKDTIDAVKIEMATSSCLIDTSVLSYSFFVRLGNEKKQFEKKLLQSPSAVLNQIVNVIGPTIKDNKVFTAIVILIVFISLLATYLHNKREIAFRLVLFNCITISIILFLAYSMKMEKWHFIPLMQILAIGNLLISGKYVWSTLKTNTIFKIALATLALFSLLFLVNENQANHISLNEKIAQQEQLYEAHKESYLFYDIGTRELLDNYVFRPFSQRNNVYFYDMAQMTYLKEYAVHLNNLCGCNSFSPVEFFSFLKQTDSVVYISTPQRTNLLKRYMQTIYQMPITFTVQHHEKLRVVKHTQGIEQFAVYQVE
ncbi:MAG: hypothetical protein KIS94_00870 [Chitinophagales bacterium]|nr:hypothetical protein [Chitinophagales bacterium]